MLGDAILRKLSIERDEVAICAWAGSTLFCVGWADASVKIVANTFFLRNVGSEALPVVFLINSFLLVGSTHFVGRTISSRDSVRILPRVYLGLGLMLLPLWLLIPFGSHNVLALLLIASKQLSSIALLVFFIAIGDLINARQSKRLIAPLIAGFTLGGIAGSFATKPLGDLIGISSLLPFACVMMFVAARAAMPLYRLRPTRLEHGLSAMRGFRAMARSRRIAENVPKLRHLWNEGGLFRLLFVPALCAGILGPMLIFEFFHVVEVAKSGPDGQENLIAFFSIYEGWIGVGVLITQLGISTNLYRRIGVPLAAAMSPLLYLIGFVGMSFQLNLTTGAGTRAATKLTDNAIYDPAQRVLFNLFPESKRAVVTTFLEGPVKRAGGVLGNFFIIGVLAVDRLSWVSFLALPIAAIWAAAAYQLWRAYPRLLLQASAGRLGRDSLDCANLIDPITLRALAPQLAGPDPANCRATIELVSDANPTLAIGALAEAARDAPSTLRSLLIRAIDRILEESVKDTVANREAAESLTALLNSAVDLDIADRADTIQAIGRLALESGKDGALYEILQRGLEDPAPAVRIAAAAALCRRGQGPEGADLDEILSAAMISDDRVTRRIAREELRALLLSGSPDAVWGDRIKQLTSLLATDSDRAPTAEAIADIARRHGNDADVVADAMLSLREDADPSIRASVMRFSGLAGLYSEGSWLVEHIADVGYPGAEMVRNAAGDGLTALGVSVADVLLVELRCGKRSTRHALLPIIRQLEVEEKTLRSLYGRELESLRNNLIRLAALGLDPMQNLLAQHLSERIAESTHTALSLLATIRGEERIVELADHFLRADQRVRAILLEVLEAMLPSQDTMQLLPILEAQDPRTTPDKTSHLLAIPLPSPIQAAHALLEDGDELTRNLVTAAYFGSEENDDLAENSNLMDDGGMLSAAEIMVHIKSLPIFEHLTTRQLMDLAKVVGEQTHPADTEVVREGDEADCMYLIVEGELDVLTGNTLLNTLGPSNFFGEMAIFEGAPRSATVVTKTRVRLLSLEKDDLFIMMDELPEIAIAICRTMSKRIRHLTKLVGA